MELSQPVCTYVIFCYNVAVCVCQCLICLNGAVPACVYLCHILFERGCVSVSIPDLFEWSCSSLVCTYLIFCFNVAVLLGLHDELTAESFFLFP